MPTSQMKGALESKKTEICELLQKFPEVEVIIDKNIYILKYASASEDMLRENLFPKLKQFSLIEASYRRDEIISSATISATIFPETITSDKLMVFEGQNGQIDLYDDRIVIRRDGAFAKITHGFCKGNKTIFIEDIGSVQIKESGLLEGYIQFSILGGNERTGGFFGSNGAATGENTVLFNGNDLYAKELKDMIENIKMKPRTVELHANNITDDTDLLRKYKALCDDGIITNEDFEAKKKAILNS